MKVLSLFHHQHDKHQHAWPDVESRETCLRSRPLLTSKAKLLAVSTLFFWNVVPPTSAEPATGWGDCVWNHDVHHHRVSIPSAEGSPVSFPQQGAGPGLSRFNSRKNKLRSRVDPKKLFLCQSFGAVEWL